MNDIKIYRRVIRFSSGTISFSFTIKNEEKEVLIKLDSDGRLSLSTCYELSTFIFPYLSDIAIQNVFGEVEIPSPNFVHKKYRFVTIPEKEEISLLSSTIGNWLQQGIEKCLEYEPEDIIYEKAVFVDGQFKKE